MFYLENDQYENICRVLREISFGSFGYRLRISEKYELYNLIAKNVNQIGEGYNSIMVRSAFQDKSSATFPYLDIYLTKDFLITDTSYNVPAILDKNPDELMRKPFKELLIKETVENWIKLKNYFLHKDRFHLDAPIYFKVNKWLYFTCFCHITRFPEGTFKVSNYKWDYQVDGKELLPGYSLFPNMVQYAPNSFYRQPELKDDEKTQEIIHTNKIVLYMEEHLGDSLPKMKDLARHFGINEKKLVHSFKVVFQQTPYAYYIDLKLQKAIELLKTTNLSVEKVALFVGYNAKSSFYQAFKRKFNVTPGVVKREALPPKIR